jgi:hypothetical protein
LSIFEKFSDCDENTTYKYSREQPRLIEDLSGGALSSGSFRLISSVYERLWSDIPPSEDESIFNKGFFGVRERNLGSSEPTPATGHRPESSWGCLHEHGLLF